MSFQCHIEDLPDQVLGHIFQYLDRFDIRSAMYVCKRWDLVAFGDGSTKILKVFMSEEAYRSYQNAADMPYSLADMVEALSESRRAYKNLTLVWDSVDIDKEAIQRILSRFSESIVSVKMHSCGCVTGMQWWAKIVNMFPNLVHLNVNGVFIDDEAQQYASRVRLEPMVKLRTLHDRQQLIRFVRHASIAFANITSLDVRLTTEAPLTRLFEKLGPKLIHLTLHTPLKVLSVFNDVHFPSLETLEVISMDAKIYRVIEDLGGLVNKAPILKNLVLLARIDIFFLQLLDTLQGTLQKLTIDVDCVDSGVLQIIGKFKKLKDLWISGMHHIDFQSIENMPKELSGVRKLVVDCTDTVPLSEAFYRDCFPNLLDLELQFEDPDDHCLRIVKQLPSLRRLSIHNPWFEAHLERFLEFCSKLLVQELHVYCCKLKLGEWDASTSKQEVPHLRKLSISAIEVDSGVYLPMVKSMSALHELQLALARPCENETVRILLDQFPRCNVVRLRRSKALFLSTAS
ncbi:uncharacterized protein LOC109426965 [Aedes albopictus]|uniref:F-box domain-containing protein n=1 Tax=Aedes albopictus TaxID=7160 RepID=A0ABM2A4W5_AEDAL